MPHVGAKFCTGWEGSYHTCTIWHTYLLGRLTPFLQWSQVQHLVPAMSTPPLLFLLSPVVPLFGHWTATNDVNPWYVQKGHIAPYTWLYSWHAKNKFGCQPLYIGKEKRLYMSGLEKSTPACRFATALLWKGDRRVCT